MPKNTLPNGLDLKNQIRMVMSEAEAELMITDGMIVNVMSGEILPGRILVDDGRILAVDYEDSQKWKAQKVISANGAFVLPGLIDSHIHVESSLLRPAEFAKFALQHGTTTVIADPHEIVNVCGSEGLRFMLEDASGTDLSFRFMLPSGVPCTPFEHTGATFGVDEMQKMLDEQREMRCDESREMYCDERREMRCDESRDNGREMTDTVGRGTTDILGLGEFMNSYGVWTADADCLRKIDFANKNGLVIDGHAPGLRGEKLCAYALAGVKTDHECTTVAEMIERLRLGMYVQMRLGSACVDLPKLVGGLTVENSRRLLLCSDDRQAADLIYRGDVDELLRVCVESGVDEMTAIRMATLNAAECYGMHDRGAIVPGRRADLIFVKNLREFEVERVFVAGKEIAGREVVGKKIAGREVAEKNIAEREIVDGAERRASTKSVINTVRLKSLEKGQLRVKLRSEDAVAIEILPKQIITRKKHVKVRRDFRGDFVFDSASGFASDSVSDSVLGFKEAANVAKVAVVERHHNTGNVATALLYGYGIKSGAIATSIAHDSHNIIVAGCNDDDMIRAVFELTQIGGGMVAVQNGKVLAKLALPIAGLMADEAATETMRKFDEVRRVAIEELGVNPEIDPVMTLSFMALPVIPELKLTDVGLYDVTAGKFIGSDWE